MYDLKPDAPAEYRGPFEPIATRLTGVHICELMPGQAQRMDRLALLRGVPVRRKRPFPERGLLRSAALREDGRRSVGRQPAARQRLGPARRTSASTAAATISSSSSIPTTPAPAMLRSVRSATPSRPGSGAGPAATARAPATPDPLRHAAAQHRSGGSLRRSRSLSGPGARHRLVAKGGATPSI